VLNDAYCSGAYIAGLGLIFTAILEDTNELLRVVPGPLLAVMVAAIGACHETHNSHKIDIML